MATLPSETITIATDSGARTVSVRWRGAALAVHKPLAKDGVPSDHTKGWAISHHGSGLSAGRFNGTLKDALKLARLWDAAFSAALVTCHHNDSRPGYAEACRPDLRDWPLRHQWSAILRGEAPIAAPDASAAASFERPAEPTTFDDGDGAEQLPVKPSLWPVIVNGERRIRLAPVLPSGVQRLRHPETGAPLRQDGDVAAFKRPGDPMGEPWLRMLWRGSWRDIPSLAQFGEWTFDSVCETPDGDSCEPDAPESWLRLVGLV